MTGTTTLKLIAAAAAVVIFAAPFAAPALGLDQIVKLYMCQTEHELKSINTWEYSDPAKFREATKNGTVMPVDAAMDRAALLVSTDKIICDGDGRVAIEKSGEGPGPAALAVLEGAELDSYCPITIRKHGHPCK
jgi:hypothetical protein